MHTLISMQFNKQLERERERENELLSTSQEQNAVVSLLKKNKQKIRPRKV